MKLDKYGDEIVERQQELDSKIKKAFFVVVLLQFLMIITNITILITGILPYVSFATAPLYIFLYIHFFNAYGQNKDIKYFPKYLKLVKFLSPILYCLTTVLVILTGF